jgi:hypothetical protein
MKDFLLVSAALLGFILALPWIMKWTIQYAAWVFFGVTP